MFLMATPEPSFFDEFDEDAEAVADAAGLAQLDAGQGIPHAEISAWLESWGAPDEKPAPATWRK
ncbi:MAG: antitoxin [Caulobacteraceae bacterium]|nr:antitoxin [Caulobacteraceae bacterium]